MVWLHVVTVITVASVTIAGCQDSTYNAYMVGPEKDRTFQMRVDEDFLKSIDDWRRKQPDLPSRSEAIRRLVAMALEASKRR